jgi:hypothetical protein
MPIACSEESAPMRGRSRVWPSRLMGWVAGSEYVAAVYALVKEGEPGQESRMSPVRGMGKDEAMVLEDGVVGMLLRNRRLSCSAELQPPWEKM